MKNIVSEIQSFNFNAVSTEKLLETTKVLASEERRITVEILHHLREIEKRRAFAERGYSSLFEYAISELGYSESAAYRRISAMRALRDTPELEESMKSGALSVSTVAHVQTFLRSEKTRQKKEYCREEKRNLFLSCQGKSRRDVERKLCEISPAQVTTRQTDRVLTPELTEIRFVVDQELQKKISKLKSLCSHKLKNPNSYSELLNLLSDVALEKWDPERRPSQKPDLAALPPAQPTKTINSRYIPTSLRREVWTKANGRCEYIDPKTSRKCESTYKLQIDHKEAFAYGGSSRDLHNLRLLCATHNALHAIQDFGIEKMQTYLK